MMTNEKIINEAKEAYTRYFKDTEGTVNPESEDVVLDQQALFEDINVMKETATKKHESMEVLRAQLNQEAEENFEKTFGTKKVMKTKKKMNIDEMYEEFNKEKEHLVNIVSDLKEQQLQKNKH